MIAVTLARRVVKMFVLPVAMKTIDPEEAKWADSTPFVQ
jgi:hypothetical protein